MKPVQLLAVLITLLFLSQNAHAGVTWLPAESTFNGQPFEDLGQGYGVAPANGGVDAAYSHVETVTSGYTALSFLNTNNRGIIDSTQLELSGTVLPVGTQLDLVFQLGKHEALRTAIVQANGVAAFVKISDTKFRIRATVADPDEVPLNTVSYAAGFALLLDVRDTSERPLGPLTLGEGLIFTSTALKYSFFVPESTTTGVTAIGWRFYQGTTTTINVFLPLSFLQLYNADTTTVANVIKTFVDGAEVPFEQVGTASDLGFEFLDTANPNNTVYRLRYVREQIGPFDSVTIGIGHTDTTRPSVVGVKSNYRVSSPTVTIKGTAKDQSALLKKFACEYIRGGDGEFKYRTRSTLKANGKFSIKLTRLQRGNQTGRCLFQDVFGNYIHKNFNIGY